MVAMEMLWTQVCFLFLRKDWNEMKSKTEARPGLAARDAVHLSARKMMQ
jgi:hypothetical protein